MHVAPGTRLGPYEIVERLGAGGMGEVWRARDTRLERSVAIKIISDEFAGDPAFARRFEREARTISQLSHPNICTLHDVGESYLVMELLAGETLASRIARGALPLTRSRMSLPHLPRRPTRDVRAMESGSRTCRMTPDVPRCI